MRHDGDRRPEQILAEIDRTRGEMDRTLTAIEQKLTPEQLMDQGVDWLRGSGAMEFAQNLGGAAKHNPLPMALTGIGIAWLMALGRDPARHDGPGSTRRADGGTEASMHERMSSARHRAGEKVGSMADTTRQQWHRARSGLDYLVKEQPLVLGAIGLAIGAAIGASAPRTRQEDELLGEPSRRLTERAKEAGAQQLEKAKHALEGDGTH